MCCEDDVGPLAVEVEAQAADHDRVVDEGQRLDLAAQAAQGVLVGHLVGPDDLDDDGDVGHLVEGQEDLVGEATPEPPQNGQLGGDQVALGQVPAVVSLTVAA